MTEIRFHSSDPSRPVRTVRVEGRAGTLTAAIILGAGVAVSLGLLLAPGLVDDLSRSADRLAVRQTAERGREAFASVLRREGQIARRVSSSELLLARLAFMTGARLPAGFPDALLSTPSRTPDDVDYDLLHLSRRLRRLEVLRRAIASGAAPDPSRIPSRSPVEPASAVPVAVFGQRVSLDTHHPEFFPGLELAVPAAEPVVAPAGGTVAFAGAVPARAGARWRRLGKVVVLAHDSKTATIFGHLGKILVRKGQPVRRGDTLAAAGASGLVAGPRLHYEVFRAAAGRLVPVDPRLFILDALWLGPEEARSSQEAPADLALPPILH